MKKDEYIRLILSIVCFLIFFACNEERLRYIIFLACHELIHSIVAIKLGYKPNELLILPFGLNINIKDDIINPVDDIKISIAGPIFNLILVLIYYFMNKLYGYGYVYIKINLVIVLFNMIPAGFLDGGRILKSFIKIFYSFYYGELLICLNGIIFGGIILIAALYDDSPYKIFIKVLLGIYLISTSN